MVRHNRSISRKKEGKSVNRMSRPFPYAYRRRARHCTIGSNERYESTLNRSSNKIVRRNFARDRLRNSGEPTVGQSHRKWR